MTQKALYTYMYVCMLQDYLGKDSSLTAS